MKDEYGGVIIDEFIGLKSKMYSMKKIDGSESNTAKGLNIATEFNEFKDVLFKKKIIRHKMKRIQAKKHKIGTYEINKISLSCFDDKRQVLDDGIHTLAIFIKIASQVVKKLQMIVPIKKKHANNKMNLVVLYVRLSGQFSNIFFLYKYIFTQKKPVKHTSNFYSVFSYV